MKIQVRQGVFETNSSSTHSLQLAKQTVDEAKNVISERIKELYSSDNESMFDESMYIEDDKLMLKGFPITSSEETACVYYIITNWVAKIQYLAMLLNEYVSNIDGFEKEVAKYKDTNDWYYQKPILPKLNVYKKFVELIKEYSKKKGLEIKDVVFEMELIKSVAVNIDYILSLIARYHESHMTDKEIFCVFGTLDYIKKASLNRVAV